MELFNNGHKTPLCRVCNHLVYNSSFFSRGETKVRPINIVISETQTQIELFSPNNKIPQNIPDNVTKYPTWLAKSGPDLEMVNINNV